MDDDEAVRFSLFSYLEDCGYNVQTSDTAEDALQKLKTEKFDVVIVDLRLPGMDGDVFIETTFADNPNLGYIIYTGSTEFTVSDMPTDVDVESMSRQICDLADCKFTSCSGLYGYQSQAVGVRFHGVDPVPGT